MPRLSVLQNWLWILGTTLHLSLSCVALGMRLFSLGFLIWKVNYSLDAEDIKLRNKMCKEPVHASSHIERK